MSRPCPLMRTGQEPARFAAEADTPWIHHTETFGASSILSCPALRNGKCEGRLCNSRRATNPEEIESRRHWEPPGGGSGLGHEKSGSLAGAKGPGFQPDSRAP